MCRVLKLMTLTTIEFDSGFPLHISPDSPCDDNNADICPLLQWPARYPSGQCLHPACAGCAEPRTGPGHKELQVLAPRPSPQPVSAASQVRAAEPGEWERETGDSEDWGLGSGERAQCSGTASSYLPGTARRRRGPPGSVPRNRASSSQLSWPQDSKNGCADGWTKIWPVLQISN